MEATVEDTWKDHGKSSIRTIRTTSVQVHVNDH